MNPIPARLLKVLLSLPFLIFAGVFGFYVLFGFFLVDPLAKKILPWVGEEKLASQLSVQQVDFNPLTLDAEQDTADSPYKPLDFFSKRLRS